MKRSSLLVLVLGLLLFGAASLLLLHRANLLMPKSDDLPVFESSDDLQDRLIGLGFVSPSSLPLKDYVVIYPSEGVIQSHRTGYFNSVSGASEFYGEGLDIPSQLPGGWTPAFISVTKDGNSGNKGIKASVWFDRPPVGSRVIVEQTEAGHVFDPSRSPSSIVLEKWDAHGVDVVVYRVPTSKTDVYFASWREGKSEFQISALTSLPVEELDAMIRYLLK